MKKFILPLGLMLLLMICVVSCAPANASGAESEYGLLGGLWHGIIFPFSLFGKIVSAILHFINSSWGNWNIGIYADNNTGLTYWVGYIIGLVAYGIPILRGRI